MAQVNLDTASRLDIVCRKGDTFSLGIDFGAAIPLQGVQSPVWGEWKMEVRTSQNDEATPIYTTIYTSSPGIIDAALTDFNFVVSAGEDTDENQKLTITAPASKMITSGEYVYDLQHTLSAATPVVKTYLYGKFTVVEDVTNS